MGHSSDCSAGSVRSKFFQNGTSTSTLAEVKTDDAEDGTVTFILLGDGRFRLGEGNSISRDHNYPNASTTYSSESYHVRKYKTDKPTARMASVKTQCEFRPIPIQMSKSPSCAKIGVSWSPSPSNEYFTILSICNNCSSSKVSGKIKYYFNSSEQKFTTSSANLRIYNNWITNSEIKASDDSNYRSMLVADYADLAYGEIRHIYIKVTVPSSVKVGANIKSKLAITGVGCGTTSSESSIEATKYPHDPNSKKVDKEKVCAKNLNPHLLNYKISFHNDGQNFCK